MRNRDLIRVGVNSEATSKVGRRVVVASLVTVVLLVAAGVVVFGRQTSWWRCSHDTGLRSESQLAYDTTPTDLPPEATDVIDQVSALPGVGDFLGSAPLANGVEVTSGVGGDIIVSDGPFIEVLENHRDISFDPVETTVSWDREQPGSMATPRVLEEDFVTFGAVEGDGYRLTSLDAADGGVNGCIQVGGADGGRIIDTAQAWSPDESAVALATPGDESTTLTRVDIDSRSRAWSIDIDEAEIQEVRW